MDRSYFNQKMALLSSSRSLDYSTIFVGLIRVLLSQLKKRKQILVLQNLKFCQISKSPDDIQTTFMKQNIIFGQLWTGLDNLGKFGLIGQFKVHE